MPVVGSALAGWDRMTEIGPADRTLPVAVIGQFALFITLTAWLVATVPERFAARVGSAVRGSELERRP
jgi:hypothetical protein